AQPVRPAARPAARRDRGAAGSLPRAARAALPRRSRLRRDRGDPRRVAQPGGDAAVSRPAAPARPARGGCEMSCPNPITCLLYADGELAGSALREIEAHLVSCRDCRARVVALREESALLGEV